ncbi:MAG: hydrogenase assembly protein HypC [Nitrospirae bacterium GWF2_44_13]|nr:MAG: hydrogenase assembly protein HypC [Nitrospirae bacterium GWF2_44_13]OGW35243.1 MAG: hydrogenase assembly protein HypC [Nitrospirae bacterium GWD2_44_7]OGW64322.1 MAG: hydrogenase assembly protein HypC [Nitrospirae bacterium RIFOXYA2_FULL_44_9]OGW70896.1 MAG: hydrogenase assembly protein HypC [Nitrospirae bacterium RIFOXYC2_FULL_44_7]HBG93331.1 HypC/HybG/HupF family hydrogenase formation chaperone [Nitrospiraceae bacterium]
MCIAVPSKIINIRDLNATVEVYGAQRNISLLLMPDAAKIGDFVLVHAGFAIQKVDKDAAEEALKYIKQMLDETGEREVSPSRLS